MIDLHFVPYANYETHAIAMWIINGYIDLDVKQDYFMECWKKKCKPTYSGLLAFGGDRLLNADVSLYNSRICRKEISDILLSDFKQYILEV